ncbi:MAG TPA: DUF998 domain-containing protein [Ktedonobacterales bacterium]|nr:DUF998 domain-containing protein [Ktedonobacterales bacterium]
MERTTPLTAAAQMSGLAAWAALVASGAALALLLSLHVLSPEYSPAWRMISEYADGRYSWVLSLMFIAYGVSSLALAVAIRSHLRMRRDHIGLALLVASGIAQASAAEFDLNQAVLHELAGVAGILCLPLAAILISPSLAATEHSDCPNRLILFAANLTWMSVVLWIASFVLMVATFLHALGGLPATPPAELPAGVIAVVGWTNRMMVLSAWCWVAIVAWRVVILRANERPDSQDEHSCIAARQEAVEG